MTDMEKLLKDYSEDMYVIAEQMYAWCEPTQELINRIKQLKRKAQKMRRRDKSGKK